MAVAPPYADHSHHRPVTGDPCLHGDATSWSTAAVIVPAVFKEWGTTLPLTPPQWLTAQYPVYLYQRLNASFPCFCINRAYESGVFLRFLVDHFTRLPAVVTFVQADWLQTGRGVQPTPFAFWQPNCALARPNEPYHRWMPLGKRRTCWPPGTVRRSASWWSTPQSRRQSPHSHVGPPLIEACWHELLRIFGRPIDPSARINLTFYPYQNFLASREQLREHAHSTYEQAYEQLVVKGTCLSSPTQRDANGAVVHDSLGASKETVAKGMEHLMHAIFGGRPLDVSDADPERFAVLPLSENCTHSARTRGASYPWCVHGL